MATSFVSAYPGGLFAHRLKAQVMNYYGPWKAKFRWAAFTEDEDDFQLWNVAFQWSISVSHLTFTYTPLFLFSECKHWQPVPLGECEKALLQLQSEAYRIKPRVRSFR